MLELGLASVIHRICAIFKIFFSKCFDISERALYEVEFHEIERALNEFAKSGSGTWTKLSSDSPDFSKENIDELMKC